ncbi:related to C2H2 type zinc finger domain protein [Phialocephala subalpina]|uniref:Related to C2H2 type zinc finger domain protein n=1 Tax=Phialocephala subalpina TaxID=576137 RepID=A0A1L7XGL5_9HELO|nr:related to C2H2 type zinc finger domain protein [Phialocephala subalpina]
MPTSLCESRTSGGTDIKEAVCSVTLISLVERKLTSPDSKHKPFSCPECSKDFGRQDVLARHRKLHQRGSVRSSSPVALSGPIVEDVHDIGADNFSPTASAISSNLPGEPFIGNTQQFHQHDNTSLPFWTDTDDMLDFLTSDFSWPVTLPVTHFDPSGFGNANSSTLSPPEVGHSHHNGQGHQAMQQMSKLISVLSSNLTAEIQNTGITSSFLDTCMHVFFDKFIPSFPVLHKATFAVRESSHPLLLNIIALGTLFCGAKDAVPKGEALWRLAHIAVATNWKHLMATKGPQDSCEGVQLVLTAVLGQTYALMSKNESLRMTSQTFHGLGFYWARQCGMFNMNRASSNVPPLEASDEEKTECWRIWAAKEVQNRSILGHYVLDGHISQFSGYPACARHVTNPLLMPASDAAFEAATPDEWIREMQKQRSPPHSFRELFLDLFALTITLNNSIESSIFTLRVVLEGLQSLAADVLEAEGHPAVGSPTKKDIATAMIRFHSQYLSTTDAITVDQLELLIRWHTIFLDLATPSTALCREICAMHGIAQNLHEMSKVPVPRDLDLAGWSQSPDGMRAVLHSLAIQEIVEKIPLGRSSGIHLPAAIFAVATIYSTRCIAGFSMITAPRTFTWESVWDVNDSGNLADPAIQAFLSCSYAKTAQHSRTKNLMYEINSLQITLNSISSRWGVSHEMDSLLSRWIAIANDRIQTNI